MPTIKRFESVTKAKSTKKPSREDFAKEYILTGCKNGTQAAINAGYSEKTAAQTASRLLKDVKVLNFVDEYKKASVKKFIKTKEEKLVCLERIMESAMTVDPEKGMLNIQGAIAAIKVHNEMQGDNAPVETNNNIKVSTALADRLTGGSKR